MGLTISGFATEDVAKGVTPSAALIGLIKQCLSASVAWKEVLCRTNERD